MNNRFVVVDIETTGNHPARQDRIIQIGLVVIEKGEITERFNTFVNPQTSLSNFIEQFTGISDQMLENAPLFKDISSKIIAYLDNAYFVAHNVPFDLTFIQAELRRNGGHTFSGNQIDTVELARILYPTLEGYKLNQLAKYFSIEHNNPHRADSDAEVTAKILLILLNKLRALPLSTLKRLYELSKYLKSDLREIFIDIIREVERTGDHTKQGCMEIDGITLHSGYLESDCSPKKLREHSFIVNKDEIQQRMNLVIDEYEKRPGQMEMMDKIDEALQTHQHLLLEAGTGIGKTIAYLVTSISFAMEYKRPVVISTNTTHLQQQLLEKDVAIVRKILPFSFRVSLLKGRNHYLCLRKFKKLLNDHEQNNNYDIVLTKAQILVWLTETMEGDIDELNLPSGGVMFWNKLTGSNNECQECTSYSGCFYHFKKAEVEKADVVITNHALLMADAYQQSNLLPNYEEVIVDEAHHLKDVASEFFGHRLSYYSLQKLLTRLDTVDGKELLMKISTFIEGKEKDKCSELIFKLNEKVLDTKFEIDELFRMIRQFVIDASNGEKNEIGRIRYQYHVNEEQNILWEHIKESASRLRFQLKDIVSYIELLCIELERQTDLKEELKEVAHTIEEALDQIVNLLLSQDENAVNWAETEEKGAINTAYLYSQPVEVHDKLSENFFLKKKSVVLTSAALTTENGSFSYMIKQFGLDRNKPQPLTLNIPSPFPYHQLVRMMVPKDLPEINETSEADFIENISQKIMDIAPVTKGRMMVLFTSYQMLEKTYDQVKKQNGSELFEIIGQGVTSGSRDKLIKKFKQSESSLLFGTNSFWEGIDIPGEDLSCLIIVRLPFPSPEQPLFKARANRMKKASRNVFLELSLPEALLRFKQGFGRLVRKKDDRGVVFVLDRRILTKAYGKRFIQSLPDIEIEEANLSHLLKKLKKWL